MASKKSTNILVNALLRIMAFNFNHRKKYNQYLTCTDGWINFSLGIRTEDNVVGQAIEFKNGQAKVYSHIPDNVDSTLIYKDDSVIKEMLNISPSEVLNLLLKNKLHTAGNLAYISLFNYFISLMLYKKQKKLEKKSRNVDEQVKNEIASTTGGKSGVSPENFVRSKNIKQKFLNADAPDKNVMVLDEPYLSEYTIEDFPRLKKFLDIHFDTMPEICPERPKLITDWCMENGFEIQKDGTDWNPELRQAMMFKHLMEHRKPIIRKDDLIAGTTTSREIGVVIYPDSQGTMIWGELKSTADRMLNPYITAPETADILHHHVFPYWAKRNFREWVRTKYNSPLCQKLDERFAVYFLWKTVALSHTIADYPKLLRIGARGIIREIDDQMNRIADDPEKKNTLTAMKIMLEAACLYSKNLSRQAEKEAEQESDPNRKKELENLADICSRVPENPCETLDQAVNAIWIMWVCLHMENTNAGLSLGRMDQWLQPYFLSDIKKLSSDEEKKNYIKHAIELIGCFYMRCTDHLPLVPDIGNYLFGGSSSDQAITLGGATPDNQDAVNDMTYIFLKATEMLSIRDPNVNARYNKSVNSETYLRRLCEVNLITTATPSMHNDDAVIASIKQLGYKNEDMLDWSATGCVEPTISGKHIGHTNCMMMNMVAALEMALNNGLHPLMHWKVGPDTGSLNNGGFNSFDDFFTAFKTQFKFLIDNSIEYNNMLGQAHGDIRPTPLLSSLIDGTISSGKDITKGGARYNSSGAAIIGLADVTDSLMAIKKLIYEEKKITFKELKAAIDDNFANNKEIYTLVRKKVPLFGSGNPEALDMAQEIARFTHDSYIDHTNYRGGKYTAGFWSMSNHVAFGTLSGALPSGRLSGKAFTPGLTPQPHASESLLDNIRDVASLNPENMSNNIAFNVKVVPGGKDTHADVVSHMYSYVKSYFDLGGMQIQLNVVSSDILRDAMLHPENYRNLLVRISGYNAYFTTLNRDMQLELIERAEYGM